MHYIAGSTPAALRQRCAVAFAGLNPQNALGVTFEPVNINKLLTYVNPNDPTEFALAQGGKFDFGNDQVVRILEIRALTALGNISVVIGDRGDTTHDISVGTPTASRLVFVEPLIVVPTQIIKVSTVAGNANGWLDVYIVKGSVTGL